MILANSQDSILEKARQYQKELRASFPKRADSILQLVEALASSEKPTSIVELSQEGAFQRSFSNVHKAINVMDAENRSRIWTEMFYKRLPQEKTRPFHLYAIDVTPEPKRHSETMEDRTFVHKADQLGIPVIIGLEASVLVTIPEQEESEAKWTLPLSVERVSSKETACEVAKKQLRLLAKLKNSDGKLSVIVTDSGYTRLEPEEKDQVIIARGRSDRVGRRLNNHQNEEKRRGRPRKYMEGCIKFREDIPLDDKNAPDEQVEDQMIYKGQPVYRLISRWNNIHLHDREGLVDVVKVELFSKMDAVPLFDAPLLLIVSGTRRSELSGKRVFECYLCRFDIEHFFRFQKQKLLFGGFQTADLRRQCNWWWICLMAYWLLYLSRVAEAGSNRKWQPKRVDRLASPGEVKRVFGAKIFPKLGSPSSKPAVRGKSNGRRRGVCFMKRPKQKVVKKEKWRRKAA